MRLVLFNDFIPGVLRGDRVVDITRVVADIPRLRPQDLVSGLLESFDRYKTAIERAAESSEGVPVDQVRLRPPTPEPGRIVCMAGNYLEGASIVSDRDAFLKSPSAIIGPGDTIVLPDAPFPHFHHEGELAFVIGKTASKVKAENASDYIFGYMNFIDVSARGFEPNGNNSFWWQKSWDTFAPIGPHLVTADEVPDPHNLDVKLWVGGEIRQDLNTNDMGRGVEEILEWLSWITTLRPGDVIATGTNHLGLGPIQDGDTIDMEIEKLGRLTVHVRDDWKRSWPREPMAKMTAFESSVRSKLQGR